MLSTLRVPCTRRNPEVYQLCTSKKYVTPSASAVRIEQTQTMPVCLRVDFFRIFVISFSNYFVRFVFATTARSCPCLLCANIFYLFWIERDALRMDKKSARFCEQRVFTDGMCVVTHFTHTWRFRQKLSTRPITRIIWSKKCIHSLNNVWKLFSQFITRSDSRFIRARPEYSLESNPISIFKRSIFFNNIHPN